jgi:hypothetical protein
MLLRNSAYLPLSALYNILKAFCVFPAYVDKFINLMLFLSDCIFHLYL